ncbi:MAG: hypothetical protein AAGB13_15835 [Cyanobacteria bacterium P01_F01_bin.33]
MAHEASIKRSPLEREQMVFSILRWIILVVLVRATPVRFRRVLYSTLALLFCLNLTYNLARDTPVEIKTGLPECSDPTPSRQGQVSLDRWHLYHDPHSNTYALTGCITNRTVGVLNDVELAAQLSYNYDLTSYDFEGEDLDSVFENLLTFEEGSYNVTFSDVPPAEARPFVVRQTIPPKAIDTLGELFIYQVNWQGKTEAQTKLHFLAATLDTFASSSSSPLSERNPCENLLGMTGDVAVSNLRIRRDAFGKLNLEGCLRNGTNAYIGELNLNYSLADDSTETETALKSMPLALDYGLESGETVYIRESVSEDETKVILQSIDWRDYDAEADRTTSITQTVSL